MMKFKGIAGRIIVALVVAVVLLVCVFAFFGNIVDGLLWVVNIFAPFLIAFLLSLILNPLAEKLQKKFKLPKGLTAVLVIVLTVGILGGILGTVIWKIITEIKSIYAEIPRIYDEAVITLEKIQNSMSHIYASMPIEFQNAFDAMGDNMKESVAKFINDNYKPVMYGAGNIAKKLPSIFIAIIVFLLSLFFIMSDEKKVKSTVKKMFPKKMWDNFKNVGSELKVYLGGYIKAQLVIMSIAFIIIFIGLSILKVQYAMLIALGLALLDALPFFGSGAALIPWSIISLLTSDIRLGVGLIIIYLAIILTRQMTESKIVSHNIGINPLLTLMSMYIGYRIFSIGGMILGPILLVLTISFHKAGALDGIEKGIVSMFKYVKNEIKELYNFIITK